MPEYLAPGVYVEEVSFRAKSIEGVSTSTAGFVGPARYGPISGEPELLTSFADFERIYGGLEDLNFTGGSQPNFLAHAVRAFFDEGGRRLYVARIHLPTDTSPASTGQATITNSDTDSPAPEEITVTARFPGAGGNMRLTFIPRLSSPVPANSTRIREHDTLVAADAASPMVDQLFEAVRNGDALDIVSTNSPTVTLGSSDLVHILTVDVLVERPIMRPKRPNERFATGELLEGFSLHPSSGNGLASYFTANPASRLDQMTVPFSLSAPTISDGGEMALALLGEDVILAAMDADSDPSERQRIYRLDGGSDGDLPGLEEYVGDSRVQEKSGLAALEDLEDISILAAPGYSYNYDSRDPGGQAAIEAIQGALLTHCERMRYRIAVLDAPNGQSVGAVRNYRGVIDSTRAALYYPWIKILDPLSAQEIIVPPSGTVAGIYARNDVDKGVHKTPANEVVRQAIGFEFLLNKAQQDVLNPEGINCFRFFEGRGYRLWGGRTVSSDPEWKYVNVRRYFLFLERSIELGTQWVVFENNGPTLWANVRRTIEDFLFNEWKSDHLLGDKPEDAFFVRCDRTTMTQNDLDNGRLICLIGVAPLKPAEFVIFRIGQFTADRAN